MDGPKQDVGMKDEVGGMIHRAQDMRIVRSDEQARLSRRWLLPVHREILALARDWRARTDEALRGKPDVLPDLFGEARTYPVGYCLPIRDGVWKGLSEERAVRSLRARGLLWKQVYYIQDGSSFQNAIQCGDWLLDVARDTCNPTLDPVEFSPLDDMVWENLDDWRRYAEIAAGYYQMTVYPNRYFPLLFPLIPFVAIRHSTGRLELLYNQQMLFLQDLAEDWRRLRALLADESWMSRRLPSDRESQLLEQARAGAFPVEVRLCSNEELTASLSEWAAWRALPDEQAAGTLKNLEKLATRCAGRVLEPFVGAV